MRRSNCTGLAVAVALTLVGWAAPAAAQDADVERYLLSAARLYENLEYERALEQLERARRTSRGLDDDVAIALYEGLILADLGKKEEARAAFKAGLFLHPDAKLPVKISPKVELEFERVRAEVKKELAPVLARKEAERKAKEEAERKAKEEEARRAEAQRRRDAEAKRRAEAEQAARDEAQRRAREQAAQPRDSRLTATGVQPRETSAAFQGDVKQARERGAPVLPFVFGGLAAAAGGAGAYFGLQAQDAVGAARDAQYQDETAAHLKRAAGPALVANILFGVAGSAGLAAIISVFSSGGDDAPAAVTEDTGP